MLNVNVIDGLSKRVGFYQQLRVSPNHVFEMQQFDIKYRGIDVKIGERYEFVLSGIDEYHVAVYFRELLMEYIHFA